LAKNDTTLIYLSANGTKVKQVNISKPKIIFSFLIIIGLFIVGGMYAIDFLIDFTQNNKIETLKSNNDFLKSRLEEMSVAVQELTSQMSTIEKKDDELRMIMGIKELDDDTRNVGIGGASFEFGSNLSAVEQEYGEEVNEYMNHLKKLEREVKLELNSYSDLLSTFNAKEDSLRHMPAINPVLSGLIISKVGVRVHPILKKKRHHDGLDIAAKKGTPIFAAADGIVEMAKYNGGYGKCVYIDHLYGYETRYGHMSQILVREGQRVKRGDKIGLVGQTGLAEGPHLHYEVRFHDKVLDPSLYYFDDPDFNEKVVSR